MPDAYLDIAHNDTPEWHECRVACSMFPNAFSDDQLHLHRQQRLHGIYLQIIAQRLDEVDKQFLPSFDLDTRQREGSLYSCARQGGCQ
jgi:hypothetical protein